MNMSAALETTDHTSCVEAGTFDTGGPRAGIEQLEVLSQSGERQIVLMLPACDVPLDRVESEVTFWLQRIFNAGYLRRIAAIRPCDEPDDAVTGHNDADMKAIIIATHAAMAKFDETRAKPIAIYYQCGTGRRPGLEYVDWMGCDRYDHGCLVFAEAYGVFEQYVNKEPDRKLMAISGGSTPYKNDPSCMVAKVNGDGRYALLNAFMWQTTVDKANTYIGIRDNGMAKAYCEAGKQIMFRFLIPHC